MCKGEGLDLCPLKNRAGKMGLVYWVGLSPLEKTPDLNT